MKLALTPAALQQWPFAAVKSSSGAAAGMEFQLTSASPFSNIEYMFVPTSTPPALESTMAMEQPSYSTVFVTVTTTTDVFVNGSSSTDTAQAIQTATVNVVSAANPVPFVQPTPTSVLPAPIATIVSVLPTAVLTAASSMATHAPSMIGADAAQTPSSTTSAPSAMQGGRTGSLLHPNADQTKTIWVAAVMLVSVLLGWNMIVLRDILYPWKMWVNVIHEGCHILVGTLCGAKIISVSIDPEKGPISGMVEGQPLITLLAGYIGSVLIGSALIMCAFDTSASKVAALIVYPMLLVCFWFGRTWARLRVVVCMAVSVAFFFIDHASALRFYVLFLGVLNAFYVLWDIIDDRIFRKANESDVALLTRLSPPTFSLWVLIWLAFTFAIVSLAILGGLHFFIKDAEAQRVAQRTFLWT